MGFLIFICIAVLLTLVVVFVGTPLRGVSQTSGGQAAEDVGAQQVTSAVREELETAREAKYREIRDAELDFRTGKLSQQDYAAIDADLRAEALTILDALERTEPVTAEPPSADPA